MEERKMIALDKSMYKVEDGKVVIESEALANAIQNEALDLFIDEEAAAAEAGGLGCIQLICDIFDAQ